MLDQKRGDKNKLYSLHEPHVYCMSKGKPEKRYEFGTKASITTTRDSGIVIGALAFDHNVFDGHYNARGIRANKTTAQSSPWSGHW